MASEDEINVAVLVWNGDFSCEHCGIYCQFKAVFKNTNDETDREIRGKTSPRHCMFCGKEAIENEQDQNEKKG